MLSKQKIKFLNSLKMAKHRNTHKLFIAEGNINVRDFIRYGMKPTELYVTDRWIERNPEELEGIDYVEVSLDELKKVTALKNPSEVLAVFAMPETDADFKVTNDELTLVLDDIKDPGNFGTIIRSADWFGVRNIVCSNETVDAYNPKVVQASMGSIARVSVSYTDLPEWLATHKGINIFGAVLNGKPLKDAVQKGKGILIIGSEAHGIGEEVMEFVNSPVTIPHGRGGGAESLNASIATAILLYAFFNV